MILTMLFVVKSVLAYSTRGRLSTYLSMSSAAANAPPQIPRAAVSVVVRSPSCSFILVQRGKEPNKGLWSLPGGKLEWGETTLQGAQRELQEECQIHPNQLEWFTEGAITVTDSIHHEANHDNKNDGEKENAVLFHYVIAQCFAVAPHEFKLVPSDDAADASWWTLDEIRRRVTSGDTTPGVLQVIERVELYYQNQLL